MKYLLVLVVVLVAFYIWRNNRIADRSGERDAPAPPPRRPAPPAIMVACLECGTHLPEGEAVQGRLGVYCCAEHRQQRENT